MALFAVQFEIHDTAANITDMVAIGPTMQNCILQAKAVPNFKHIVSYMILRYNDNVIINPIPIIYTFS